MRAAPPHRPRPATRGQTPVVLSRGWPSRALPAHRKTITTSACPRRDRGHADAADPHAAWLHAEPAGLRPRHRHERSRRARERARAVSRAGPGRQRPRLLELVPPAGPATRPRRARHAGRHGARRDGAPPRGRPPRVRRGPVRRRRHGRAAGARIPRRVRGRGRAFGPAGRRRAQHDGRAVGHEERRQGRTRPRGRCRRPAAHRVPRRCRRDRARPQRRTIAGRGAAVRARRPARGRNRPEPRRPALHAHRVPRRIGHRPGRGGGRALATERRGPCLGRGPRAGQLHRSARGGRDGADAAVFLEHPRAAG